MSEHGTGQPDPFRVGEWLVEPALGRMSHGTMKTTLEPKTMAVLQVLASRPGEVVSGDFLVDQVWGGRPMGDNPVYKCIAQLRKTFGDRAHNPEYIATVPKRGYRLLAPVGSGAPAATLENQTTRNHPSEGQQAPSPANRPAGAGLHLAATFALVSLALILAISEIGGTNEPPQGDEQTEAISLAIIPFALQGDLQVKQEARERLARDIADRLSGNERIRIVAIEGGAANGLADAGPARMAEQLGADHLLSGRIDSRSDSLVLQVAVHDNSGTTVWRADYTLPPDEQGMVPPRISREIARQYQESLDSGLTPQCNGTTIVEACQHYLMARMHHIRQRLPRYKPQAVDLLHSAIAEDPEYAAAYAALGHVFLMPDSQSDWSENRQQARLAIERALELDEGLPEAIAVRGLEQMTHSQGPCPPACFDPLGYAAAEATLRRAIELKPENPLAHLWLALALSGQGQAKEAFHRLETAMAQDPLDPLIKSVHSLFLAYQGDIDEARRQILTFQQHHPEAPAFMYNLLAHLESRFGAYDASLRYALKGQEASSGPAPDPVLLAAYRDLGLFEEMTLILQAASEEPVNEFYLLMHHHASASRGEAAALASLIDEVSQNNHATHADYAKWPRWALRGVGRSRSALGNHELAIEKLRQIYPASGGVIDHNEILLELDAMHWLVFSLQAVGRDAEARALIESSLEHIENLEAQGFGRFPDLVLAKARAYGLDQRKALAMTHLRQAVGWGWRGYWRMLGDPRWDALSMEPDFQELLIEVRRTVDAIDLRLVPDLALAKPESEQPSPIQLLPR